MERNVKATYLSIFSITETLLNDVTDTVDLQTTGNNAQPLDQGPVLQEWLLVKYPSSAAGYGRRHAT